MVPFAYWGFALPTHELIIHYISHEVLNNRLNLARCDTTKKKTFIFMCISNMEKGTYIFLVAVYFTGNLGGIFGNEQLITGFSGTTTKIQVAPF